MSDSAKTVSLKVKPAMQAIEATAGAVSVSLTGSGSSTWATNSGDGSVQRSFTVTLAGATPATQQEGGQP